MSLFGDNRLSLEEYFSKENNNNSSLSALVGFFNCCGWEEFKKMVIIKMQEFFLEGQ